MGNIIVGIIIIIAGSTGKFVLKGTNSSALLIVFGIGLIIWGIIKIANDD